MHQWPEVIMSASSKGKPWYLDIDNNERRIYLYKDGKKLCQEGGPNSGKEYEHVCQLTRHKPQPDSDAILLKVYPACTGIIQALIWFYAYTQFKFTVGKSRGFPTATFDWQKSNFSKFFHIKGVKDEESFIQTWDTHVAPSVDPTTGVYTCGTVVGGNQLQSPTSTSMPNPRKRTAEQQPPALLPTKKVCPSKKVGTESGSSTAAQGHNMDEEIRKGFVGMNW